jgi:hypothetical protein
MKFIVLLATVIASAAASPAFGTTSADAPKPQAAAEASSQMLAFSIHPRMPRPRWP